MDRKRKLDVNPVDVNALGGALAQPNKGLNPYTGRPYSNRYYDILQKRTGEPMLHMIPPSEHHPMMLGSHHVKVSITFLPSSHL